MLNKLNCRGISLIEILITIALISLISPIIVMIFTSALHTFVGGTNYLEQQYKRQDIIASIRQDIERAKKVSFIDLKDTDGSLDIFASIKFEFEDDELKTWQFEDDELKVKIKDGSFITVVRDVDSNESYFAYFTDGYGDIEQLVLGMMPLYNDKILNRGSNVQELITTEFSVRYKRVERVE